MQEITPTDFEKILCRFCEQDLPDDFTITHDVKKKGGDSEALRQIDVWIEGKLGINEIIIAGEAKLQSKKVGAGDLDKIVRKYLSSEVRKVSKVIFFSNAGFTKSFVKGAKKHSIEMLEPDTPKQVIQEMQSVIGVAEVDKFRWRMSEKSKQPNKLSQDWNKIILMFGKKEITLSEYFWDGLLDQLKSKNESVEEPVKEVKFTLANQLYRLDYPDQDGYKYYGNFTLTALLRWIFYVAPTLFGVIKHINSGEVKYLQLLKNSELTVNVLRGKNSKIFDESKIKKYLEQVTVENGKNQTPYSSRFYLSRFREVNAETAEIKLMDLAE